MKRLVACLLFVLSANSVAQPAPPEADQDASGLALVDAFGLFCVQHFTAKQGLPEVALGLLTELPPDRVRDYLLDHPGRAWLYRAQEGTYVVYIGDPPNQSCTIIRDYTTQPHYRLPWLRLTNEWAARAGRTSFGDEDSSSQRGRDLLLEYRSRSLHDADHDDAFSDVKVTYDDGHIRVELSRDIVF